MKLLMVEKYYSQLVLTVYTDHGHNPMQYVHIEGSAQTGSLTGGANEVILAVAQKNPILKLLGVSPMKNIEMWYFLR